MHSEPIRSAYRPISPAERELLAALLDEGFEGADLLRAQVDSAMVAPVCGCGCGSIGFRGGRRQADAQSTAVPAPVEGVVLDDDGNAIGGLLLFVRDGQMTELENYANEDRPLPMPNLSHVQWVEMPR